MNDAGANPPQAAAHSNAGNAAGDASRPLVNFEQAHNFLAALAPGETHFTFQTFDDTKAERPQLARVIHGPLAERLSELSRLPPLARACSLP